MIPGQGTKIPHVLECSQKLKGGEKKHNRKKENNSEKIEKIKNYFTRMHFYLTFSTTNLKFILVFHAFLRALTERPARGH